MDPVVDCAPERLDVSQPKTTSAHIQPIHLRNLGLSVFISNLPPETPIRDLFIKLSIRLEVSLCIQREQAVCEKVLFVGSFLARVNPWTQGKHISRKSSVECTLYMRLQTHVKNLLR